MDTFNAKVSVPEPLPESVKAAHRRKMAAEQSSTKPIDRSGPAVLQDQNKTPTQEAIIPLLSDDETDRTEIKKLHAEICASCKITVEKAIRIGES